MTPLVELLLPVGKGKMSAALKASAEKGLNRLVGSTCGVHSTTEEGLCLQDVKVQKYLGHARRDTESPSTSECFQKYIVCCGNCTERCLAPSASLHEHQYWHSSSLFLKTVRRAPGAGRAAWSRLQHHKNTGSSVMYNMTGC